MRVTLLCSDLSQNGLARACLLAEILARDFEVELAGTTFGDGVWRPAAAGRFRLAAVPGAWWPRYARPAARLLGALRGDVLYAAKPLASSFGLALLDRARTGRAVVLDVDDDELAFRPPGSLRRPGRLLASVLHPNGRLWTRALVRRAASADAVTVASRGLQARFGGVLVPHAKDTARLRPEPGRSAAARAALGVAGERVVMFMGTPRPFKGIEDVAAAVALLRNRARFVVAGADPEDPYVRSLRESFPEVRLHPPYSLDEGAFLLQAADAVVVPQRPGPETAVQLPSKLLDAMALAKPVVATGVGDAPEILAEGRGLVVPPGDVAAIARALDRVFDAPEEAAGMGARARAWCERHASYDAVQPVLAAVVAEAAERARRRSGRGRRRSAPAPGGGAGE